MCHLAEQCLARRALKAFSGLGEHLLVLMFPRHKVTSASLAACLLLFVRRSTEGRAHWREWWCHHCDHCCAVWCPIFDQASSRAGQNVCLRAARRNSGLPVLINAGSVFVGPKIVLATPSLPLSLAPPPPTHKPTALYSQSDQQKMYCKHHCPFQRLRIPSLTFFFLHLG